MISLNNMILWNGLPALITEKENDKRLVVFSNVNGEFAFCNIGYDERDDKAIYEQLEKAAFFDCLHQNQEYVADELTVILSLTEKCNCQC